jgi:hypothetical protein
MGSSKEARMTFDYTKMTPAELRASVNVPQKRVRGNAVTRLSKAVARQVRDNSDDLARRLFLRAFEGDVNCSKLLVTLIEKIPSRKPRRKQRVSGFKLLSRSKPVEESEQFSPPALQDEREEFKVFLKQWTEEEALRESQAEPDPTSVSLCPASQMDETSEHP